MRIICAAIHKRGELDISGQPLIYCGLRHNNILWQGKHVSRDPYDQGFLTSKGTFVNRTDAAKIALEAGQIEKLSYSSTQLFSEDLY